MTREYDPMEELLLREAVANALAMINGMVEDRRVSIYVQSGDTTFHLHLSILTKEQKESALPQCDRGDGDMKHHCWHETFRHEFGEDYKSSSKCCWCGKIKNTVYNPRLLNQLASAQQEQEHGKHLR